MKALSYCYGHNGEGSIFWFRVFGYGLMFKSNKIEMLFSERYGLRKYWLVCGFRVSALRPCKELPDNLYRGCREYEL